MLASIFITLSLIYLYNKKKLFSFLGMSYVFSCVYIYYGTLYVFDVKSDNYVYIHFICVMIIHFFTVYFFSKEESIEIVSSNYYKTLFYLSNTLCIVYLLITLGNFSYEDLEIKRLSTFFDYKILYYNLLFFWPFTFLTQKRISKRMTLTYLLTCYLTGFRALLVNFIFLSLIKLVVTEGKSIFNIKSTLLLILILGAVIALTIYRANDVMLFSSLIHRVFIVNAENVKEIIIQNPNLGIEQFIRDFVPVRIMTSTFLNYTSTTAELLTMKFNYSYFQSGRIMTPTSLGLLISSYGINSVLFYPIILLLVDKFLKALFPSKLIHLYLIFLSISMVTRGIWSVLALYFLPVYLLLLAKKILTKK